MDCQARSVQTTAPTYIDAAAEADGRSRDLDSVRVTETTARESGALRWCPGHYDAAIAPDLIITVRSPALDRALVRRLRATAKESGTAAIAGLRSVGGVIFVDGHSALADHADWKASVWSFSLEGREKLVGAVDLILAALPGRFTLEAAWAGDATLRADSISREELRHRIVENQVEIG